MSEATNGSPTGPSSAAKPLLSSWPVRLGIAAVALVVLFYGLSASGSEAMIQHLTNGATLGSLFALIALGYTMVYGIIELINFAHGEIFMVGSFLALLALKALHGIGIRSGWIALPIAFLAAMAGCACVGILLDGIAYRPLRKEPLRRSIVVSLAGIGMLWLVLSAGAGEVSIWRPIIGAAGLVLAAGASVRMEASNRGAPRKVPRLNALLSAIGASIFLQNFVLLYYGSDLQVFPQLGSFTGIPSGRFFLGPVSFLWIEVMIITVSVLVMLGLDRFVNGSPFGRGMRAVAQDSEAAEMMGVPVNRVITLTFVVGSALAAVAGTLYGLRYGGVKYNDGFLIGIKAFTAAVLGGIGSIRGAMLGGMLLGLSETVLVAALSGLWLRLAAVVPELPDAEFYDYKDAIAFVILILILVFRPAGLLGVMTPDKV